MRNKMVLTALNGQMVITQTYRTNSLVMLAKKMHVMYNKM